jgi:hypothetical protein
MHSDYRFDERAVSPSDSFFAFTDGTYAVADEHGGF